MEISFTFQNPFIEVGQWCYFLNQTQVTFGQAIDSCIGLNSHLAYITTEQEQMALEPYLTASGETCKYLLCHCKEVP